MKNFYKILVLFLGLCLIPLCAGAIKSIVSGDASNAGDKKVKTYSDNFPYQAATPINIHADGFSLVADSGSLLHDLDISVAFIPYKGGTPLPSDMENVTGVCEGVRLLPNGEHFSETNPARITLSYNPDRLPMGYEPNEIYTYYCDDASRWHRLARVKVDTVAHTVTSLTTHFTDFANAVIKVPEMPESKAFVPTMVTDLPDVDPMKGVPMVAAPTPNNKGTAELTYPIDLPKGRNGMQPNVDLHYSSAGGNGVLGVGWSLNLPAITIDTRWGVPRYDPIHESEQYLVNGAPILQRDADGAAMPLPYQDTTFSERTMGAVRFYARDTKNADRIMRYGTNPTDYYWVVTDRNGVTTYYGRKFDPEHPEDNSIDENSVVRTTDSCIAYWAATATVDIDGNYILYTNEKYGNNIHIKRIDYTGNWGKSPTYRVNFTYNGRSDDFTNGRLGVLQTEDMLLCNIVVQYINPDYYYDKSTYDYDNLAAYYFHYTIPEERTLFKSRLESIVMLDSIHDIQYGVELLEGCGFDTEILDSERYRYRKIRNNVYDNYLYEEAKKEADRTHHNQRLEEIKEEWQRPYGESSIPVNVTTFDYEDAPYANRIFSDPKPLLNAEDMDLQKYLEPNKTKSANWGIGGTATVGAGFNVCMTTISGGGNYDYSRSKGECKTMWMDINGDGLTDILFEKDGQICCKLRKDDYAFENHINALYGLSRLSREVTNTHTWGLQLSLGANLSYSNPISTTYTDSYFADINADGLPDFIDGENNRILINHLYDDLPYFDYLNPRDYSPTISVNNSSCNKGITLNGTVNPNIECEVEAELDESVSLESVYRCEPWQEQQYEKLTWDEFKQDRMDPATNKLLYNPSACQYYRIKNGKFNRYHLKENNCISKIDPEIETVKVWVAPQMGTIEINDEIALQHGYSPDKKTEQGVNYSVLYYPNVEKKDETGLKCGQEKVLYNNSIYTKDPNTTRRYTLKHKVSKGDIIMFRLRTSQNNYIEETTWKHKITLNPIPSGSPIQFDSEKDFVCTGDGHFTAANKGTVVLSISGNNEGSIPVCLMVRNNLQFTSHTLNPGKVNLSFEYEVEANDSIIINLMPLGNNEPRWSDIHIIPHLKYISNFEKGDSGDSVSATIDYYPDIKVNCSSLYSPNSPYCKLFGTLHKGWGQFAYKRNPYETDDGLIHLDRLVNTQLQAAEYVQKNESSFKENESAKSFDLDTNNINISSGMNQLNNAFAEGHIFNPIADNNYWVPMRADSYTEQYIAYGNLGCIGKRVHSNARVLSSPYIENVGGIKEYNSSLPYPNNDWSDWNENNKLVRKRSRSEQNSFSWGGPVLINNSASKGTYDVEMDYMDMNGDGFPDFVGRGAIQYSMPWGGIGELLPVDGFVPFHSTNTAYGESFSASSAQMEKIAGNNVRDGKFDMSACMGVSTNFGSSSTRVTYMDVNADGLPDQVDLDRGSVRYNLGYCFSEKAYSFKNVKVNEGTNISVGGNGSAAFSIGQVSISGGVGASGSTADVKEMLIDINGDGLPDRVRGNTIIFNKGGRDFDGSMEQLNIVDNIGHSKTTNVSTNIGVTGGFTFCGVAKVDFGIQATPYGESTSVSESMFCDMNGDGFVDYVYKAKDETLYVCYNQTGRANLLSHVTNPTGQELELHYTLSDPSKKHKNRQWNLTTIHDIDQMHLGEQVKITTKIYYDDAYYDNFERTDYGYKNVRILENGSKVCDQYYHNRSLLQNGELKEELLSSYGKKYIRRVHESRFYGDSCDDANAQFYKEGYWTEYYEGNNDPQITTYYNVEYDQYHNVVKYTDEGDIATSDDDWRQEISYVQTEANNMVSLPETEIVYDGNDEVLRSASIEYNQYVFKPEYIHRYSGSDESVTQIGYDEYGNISFMYMPTDNNGLRLHTNFGYDSETQSYVTSINNSLELHTKMEYDPRWGVPTKIIDPAGNETRYMYDYKGRLEKVIAPRELNNGEDYTIKYTYDLINHNLRDLIIPHSRKKYWYNIDTRRFAHVQKEAFDPEFVQSESSLYDRRGNLMQKKHLAEVYGKDKWVVDMSEEWDGFGRTIRAATPFIAHYGPEEYEYLGGDGTVITKYSYDVLDRPTSQTNPDETGKIITYGVEKDADGVLRFATKVFDENDVKTVTLQSPQGWTIQQIAGDGNKTNFKYSPIGELREIVDADGYFTFYEYDKLGRLRCRGNYNDNKTLMKYDLAGNLISKQTYRLFSKNEEIWYKYNYGRLQDIHYPYHDDNDVHFDYDNAGRIAKRTDGTGSEEFSYDQLGNLARSLRRIVVPSEGNAYVFETNYKYDSFGRMRSITYPDGEIVKYDYTTGGLLKNVMGNNVYIEDRLYDEQGRKTFQYNGNGTSTRYEYDPERQWLRGVYTESGNTGDVLQDLTYDYDNVGNITRISQFALGQDEEFGGAYENTYNYDEQYRLIQSDGDGAYPYHFESTYSPAGRMGYKNTNTYKWQSEIMFGYDKEAHHPRTFFDPEHGGMDLYWDLNGNLAQMISKETNSARLHEWDEENRLRFVLGEKYAGYYGYDGNGERVYKLTGTSSIDRFNSGEAYATAIFDNLVLYPNPYMVITKKGYTKHYYAGSEKIATVMGQGGLHNPIDELTGSEKDVMEHIHQHYYNNEDPFMYKGLLKEQKATQDIYGQSIAELEYQSEPLHLDGVEIMCEYDILKEAIYNNENNNGGEDMVFFSHSDHLGSASWVTDVDGIPVQYMHYAPYGEMMAYKNFTDGLYNERYKFTGKERDGETGYDYFGARYFWSALGHWLSVDPWADKYPGISPYAYCAWNPIKYVDPDGRDVWELDGVGSVVNKITDETQDAIRMNGKQISFEPNSITGVSQNDYQTTFTFENEGVASKTFKFLADNSGVEYGLVNSSQKSTIVTQHDKEHVNTTGIINSAISNNETINYIIHNHPNNSGPSGFGKGSTRGDKYALRGTENKLGYNINAYVYQPRYNSIWPFSSSSRNEGGSTWNLPTIGNQTTANSSLLFKVKNFFGYKMKL